MKQTVGGDRLGSGGKRKVAMKHYERSTHDLSFRWKSTAGVGTLIPFMSQIGLPADNFEIKLNTVVHTIPTNGPLFGSFKVQLDVFQCPVRLYIKQLHNNQLKAGLNMDKIHLPQVELTAVPWENPPDDIDNAQINPSCIFSYLDIRGVGVSTTRSIEKRQFNACSWLAYWDVYKNYYANKQEEIGAVIHTPSITIIDPIESVILERNVNAIWSESSTAQFQLWQGDNPFTDPETGIFITFIGQIFNESNCYIKLIYDGGEFQELASSSSFELTYDDNDLYIKFVDQDWLDVVPKGFEILYEIDQYALNEPNVVTFPLDHLDDMREHLLMNSNVVIDNQLPILPYQLALQVYDVEGDLDTSMQRNQEGLGLKTYQSDLFNNWLSTEWLDGNNGINEITKVAVDDDGFYLDDLNIMKKIYMMLNRVAVSDGSYKSWLETVYDKPISNWTVEAPVYVGGLIKELAFDEVVSTAATSGENVDQPIGTLAGKGVMTQKNKGGFINVKFDEPSVLLGIFSLTPRIDYSQGNHWSVNLKTMDDFHKPQLDGIGFQELITDQMAWFSTAIDGDNITFRSAGKQPAWTHYMTEVNKTRGNFAIDGEEMFMTLNRKYEPIVNPNGSVRGIKDLTTYIDPSKYNDIFSYNKIDAQNFWVQIQVDITARRKMSSKIMPNL